MSDDESEASSVALEEEEVDEEEASDLSDSDVCTKYQEASKIVNLALTGLVSQCIPGAKVIDLCQFGSSVITSQAAKLYTKKVKGVTVERGVAFPVCISVNEIVCNHSPLSSEELPPLSEGDLVKIDLGCHIDGFISVAAHTLVVPPSADTPVDEAQLRAKSPEIGNVAVAAYNAMLAAAAAVTAGGKNSDVTETMERVAKAYGVSPISSVRMHQMKRFVIDGTKEVALRDPSPKDEEDGEEKVPPCTFEQFEVYAIDVAMSTGDGKARPGTLRTTVYKRNVEANYKLKMKASRYVLSEVDKKYPTLPFTLRHFEDERQAKMGITECVAHGLLTPYPSLHERTGEYVAHFKCTVLLLPSGTSRVTGLELPSYFNTDKTPDDETAKVLAEVAEKEAKKKAKAAKKKKKKAKK
mmetsp:Transcript_24308/g.35518  ORF Transcript_24308/g.35518 Transcript_24308/m.35518 type:complete len:411 (+) Transcript_24308:43-1275(+)|eukprot:CAMPEP_0195539660 /NCGR_PEP_ID=MMETSP0794_2-20130614/50170_1 /TAXON_ID=515487 /ORGANISM="Stephanopyxis turris, Strain CCMP 815" /LENGTH=410 /DNA_ID=CAMNT_0040673701 /DNA_START=619 /DNA_END=1851 /DNA_ORIENTATION=+